MFFNIYYLKFTKKNRNILIFEIYLNIQLSFVKEGNKDNYF